MKVVLTKDVKKIGRANETVTTADGFALNYLIPKKLAVPATPVALKEAELRMRQVSQRHELDAKLFQENIASLEGARVVIKAKANEKGHLYDAVGAVEISAAAKAQASVDLPEESIKLEKPIKEIGTFEVPLSFGETFGRFSLTVEAE